jgi:hypothetical protein
VFPDCPLGKEINLIFYSWNYLRKNQNLFPFEIQFSNLSGLI